MAISSGNRSGLSSVAAWVGTCLIVGSCGGSPTIPSPPRLTIVSITPGSASTTGGTTVTITGTGFGADATVTFGGVAATNVSVQGTTVLTATAPSVRNTGPTDIIVNSAGLTATLSGRFTFVAPSGANQPPAVTSISSVGSRVNQPSGFADIDETVTLVATVTDKETPTGSLSFQWTGPGTFSGSGPSVTWHIPPMVGAPPVAVAVKLEVVELYTEGTVTHRNVGIGEFVMIVHDSQKEIMDMGEDFLTLFSRSEVPTDVVLHNFSPTCDGGNGRADEKSDVDNNRALFIEDFSKFTVARRPPVTFNFGGRCPFRLRRADACSSFTVHWEVTFRSGPMVGLREFTDGVDYVTAVLEGNRWRLCHSDFDGTVRIPSLGIVKHVTW